MIKEGVTAGGNAQQRAAHQIADRPDRTAMRDQINRKGRTEMRAQKSEPEFS